MKSIAFTVVLTFFTTSLGISPHGFAATGVPMPKVSSLAAGTFAIPAELGQVTDKAMGDPTAPAFIHIQSAHGNYQAEKNIEKLLTYIEKNSTVQLMLLEGAANKLQPELFRLFPQHPDFNHKVTDKLMQEGYLTGPESFLIESANKTEGWGIENLGAYKKDRDAFISVVKSDKTAQAFLLKLRATIERRFASKLNKDLLYLVRQEEALGSGTVSFESWIKTLGEGSKKYLKQDLSDAFYQDQYPFLIRYFRLQMIGSKIDREKVRREADAFLAELVRRKASKEILGNFKAILQLPEADLLKTFNRTTDGYSTLRRVFDLAFNALPKDFSMTLWPNWTLYAQYIILMQEMEGKGLHEEAVHLKDEIQAALAKTLDEKEYLVKVRELYLLRQLFNLELTRAEYEELMQAVETSDVRDIRTIYKTAMDFYSIAVDRENKMFRNALMRMSLQKQDRAVIVTGGFHADGLKKLAASKNCSYIQITPRIAEVSKRDHEVYLRSILGNRSIETSQMSRLLVTVPGDMVHVMGSGEAARTRSEIRSLVDNEINSVDVSDRTDLKLALAGSVFGFQTPTLASVRKRTEIRGVAAYRSEVRKTEARKARVVETAILALVIAGSSALSAFADHMRPVISGFNVKPGNVAEVSAPLWLGNIYRIMGAPNLVTVMTNASEIIFPDGPTNQAPHTETVPALQPQYFFRLNEILIPGLPVAPSNVVYTVSQTAGTKLVQNGFEMPATPTNRYGGLSFQLPVDMSGMSELVFAIDPKGLTNGTVQFKDGIGGVQAYNLSDIKKSDNFYHISPPFPVLKELIFVPQDIENGTFYVHLPFTYVTPSDTLKTTDITPFATTGRVWTVTSTATERGIKATVTSPDGFGGFYFPDGLDLTAMPGGVLRLGVKGNYVAATLRIQSDPTHFYDVRLHDFIGKEGIVNIKVADIVGPTVTNIQDILILVDGVAAADPAVFFLNDQLAVIPDDSLTEKDLTEIAISNLSSVILVDQVSGSTQWEKNVNPNLWSASIPLNSTNAFGGIEFGQDVNISSLTNLNIQIQSGDLDELKVEINDQAGGRATILWADLKNALTGVGAVPKTLLKSVDMSRLKNIILIRPAEATGSGTALLTLRISQSRSEARATEYLAIPQVLAVDKSSLVAKLGTAMRVAANTVSPLLAVSPAYASDIAPELFPGTVHYQTSLKVPSVFAVKWPMLNRIVSHFATASNGRMVIDQRQGVSDAASVLPLVTFALYNPKAAVVLALVADTHTVEAFVKKLAAISPNGAFPKNFKVQAFANENEFVNAFAGFYNSAAPLGQSIALITDREDSVVTQKIGSRRHLLSVIGDQNPLKQTASALLAADKLLNDAIWSMGYHFVSVEKLGGLEALMAELTSFVAAQAKVLASA